MVRALRLTNLSMITILIISSNNQSTFHTLHQNNKEKTPSIPKGKVINGTVKLGNKKLFGRPKIVP
jgi:hypothetical protein